MHPLDDQLLFLEDADVLQSHGAGDRVAGVGEAVEELAALVDQHLGDLVAHHEGRERLIARGQPLGQGHEVGLEAVIGRWRTTCPVRPKPQITSSAASSTSYLRRQDALHLGPVDLRRHQDAAGAHDRLADEGRHIAPAPSSRILSSTALGRLFSELFRRKLAALVVPMGLEDVHEAGQRQVGLAVHDPHAAEAGGGHGGAVVGVVAADEGLLGRAGP